ncbi:hypothetical protein QJS10_CPA08g01493 [Acorus calamus]|uniref:Uncharacterized protein n=1 Tax=Acorus calamus TaxID=4465 RepID=A0AAV9E988_ACOCL|nr:hypothetical protein QJS10_CPA08g01493 [Acorus calamus]
MVERRFIFPNQRAKDLYNLLIEEAEMMEKRRQMLLAALEKEEEEQQARKRQKRNGVKQLRRCNQRTIVMVMNNDLFSLYYNSDLE